MTSVFLRPDADSSDGGWLNEASSGTNLFASVDDTTSTGADTDYVRSSSAQGDKVRLRLSDPGVTVTSPMVVRYRVKAEALPAALVGRLYQGTGPGTLVAYWEELPTTSFATYTYTLTTTEFNSISDFNDLYVEFEYDSAAPHLSGNIDLWFEADTYYDSSLDPSGTSVSTDFLSCSRASSGYAQTVAGTLTNFATDELRITDKGLLVEDPRTNLALQSADASTTWAVSDASVTTNQAAAPDGTTTMDKISDGTTAGVRHIVYQSFGIFQTQLAASVFVKDVDRRYVQLLLASDTGGRIHLIADLQTGTITQSGVQASIPGTAFTSASIEAFANSTYRLTLVGTTTTAAGTSDFMVVALSDVDTLGANFNGNPTYTGTNKSIHIWGMQLEQAAFASSYIPTTTTSATRAADLVTCIGNLDTVFSGSAVSMRTDHGPVLFQANHSYIGGVPPNVRFGTQYGDTRIIIKNGDGLLYATPGGGASVITDNIIGAAGFNGSGRSVVANGGTVATDSSTNSDFTTATICYSGADGGQTTPGYTRRITAWNIRLSDATLQGLTNP